MALRVEEPFRFFSEILRAQSSSHTPSPQRGKRPQHVSVRQDGDLLHSLFLFKAAELSFLWNVIAFLISEPHFHRKQPNREIISDIPSDTLKIQLRKKYIFYSFKIFV